MLFKILIFILAPVAALVAGLCVLAVRLWPLWLTIVLFGVLFG